MRKNSRGVGKVANVRYWSRFSKRGDGWIYYIIGCHLEKTFSIFVSACDSIITVLGHVLLKSNVLQTC